MEANCTTFVFVCSPREALHVSQLKIIIIYLIAGLGETHSCSETRSDTSCFRSSLSFGPIILTMHKPHFGVVLAVHLSIFGIWLFLLLYHCWCGGLKPPHQLHMKPVIQANTAALQPVCPIFAFPSKHSKKICVSSSFQTRDLFIRQTYKPLQRCGTLTVYAQHDWYGGLTLPLNSLCSDWLPRTNKRFE